MNRVHVRSRGRNAGVSLIELMIALAIGTVLILALVQVFGASRTAYQMSEGMARVQENARFAMDYLQRDIRMAGHFGCVNDQAHWVREEGDPVNHLGVVSASHDPLDFSISIQGYEAADTAPGQSVTLGAAGGEWSPALPSVIKDGLEPLPGSDIIVLRHFGSRGVPVTDIGGTAGSEELAVTAEDWDVLTDEGVGTPTLFGLADCSFADVFAGAYSGGVINIASSTTLADRYTVRPAGQTSLYRANSIVYYVALNLDGNPALHRARYNGGAYTTEELVEGIESLQLLYGQDSTPTLSAKDPPTGNVTDHNTASGVHTGGGTTNEQIANAWRRVGLVQVGMLVASPNPAAAPQASGTETNPRVLDVEYLPAASNDTHYRSVYEATIALRNRLFGN